MTIDTYITHGRFISQTDQLGRYRDSTVKMNETFSFDNSNIVIDKELSESLQIEFRELKGYTNAEESENNLFAPGVLYISKDTLVFEMPPRYVNIDLIPQLLDDINEETAEIITFRVPLPWQVYKVTYNKQYNEALSRNHYTISSIKTYFSKGPVSDYDSCLYTAPITNHYKNGQLCMPYYGSLNDETLHSDSLPSLMQGCYERVWNSGFNLDLTQGIVWTIQYFQTLVSAKGKDNLKSVVPQIAFESSRILPSTYYLQYAYIERFFKNWESIDLVDILEYDWAPALRNSETREIEAAVLTSNEIRREFDLYLAEVLNMSLSSSSSPCESCYEEECISYECECGCHSEDVHEVTSDSSYYMDFAFKNGYYPFTNSVTYSSLVENTYDINSGPADMSYLKYRLALRRTYLHLENSNLSS